MEFCVLGPLMVSDLDAPVSLGGPQQQRVLAVLLAHANSVVSTDRLIDELWGDSPPDTARKAVQSYVAQLRKAVNVEGELLHGEGRGYVLEVKPDQVDSLRFEELATEGRALLRSDAAAAATVLRQGLGLWRGAPFDGVGDESPSLRDEAVRLEGLRLTATEDQIEADLVSGHAGGLVAELNRLTGRYPFRERLRALQMLALYRAGRQSEALRAFGELRAALAEELGLEPSPELARLEQRILDHDPLLESGDPLGTVALPVAEGARRNPYKGLRSFDEGDSADFFGRRELVRRLIDRLGHRDIGRLVVLVGASGSGKSSVVRAGLIPAVRHRAVPGSDRWHIVQMFPGRQPFEQFRHALSADSGQPPGTGEAEQQSLAEIAHQTGPILLVIDQFEELFTLVPDPQTQARFLDWLAAGIGEDHGVRVLATLRADLLDRPLQHPRFAPHLDEALLLIPPLGDHEVRDAVVEPAATVGVRAEPDLVAAIIRDVATRPTALPLLQYALTDLFERRRGDTLTADAYQAAGGILGALGRRADDLYLESTETEQEIARQMFLRLVTFADDTDHLRRRVPRRELADLPVDPAALDRVIETYGRYRLLTFDRDPGSGDATVEVAHEALLREWPRLHDWLEAGRHALRLHRRLTVVVRDWEDAERDPSYLVDGAQLAAFEGLSGQTDLTLTRPEQDFVVSSRDKAAGAERAKRRRRRTLTAVLTGATVLALGLAAFALAQRERAQDQTDLARIREFAAAAIGELDNDPQRSLLLALEASEMSLGTSGALLREAEEAVRRALLESRLELIVAPVEGQGSVDSVATVFDPSGQRLAVGSSDGVVRIFDSKSGELISQLDGHTDAVIDVKWSEDGSRLLTMSFDGTARLWDPPTGSVERIFGPVPGGLLIGSMAPDGSRVVATAFDGTVRVWSTSTGEELLQIQNSLQPVGVAFDPVRGDRIAVALDGPGELGAGVRIYNADTGRQELSIPAVDGMCELRWSPDGTRIATASADTTGRVWDTATGAEIAVFEEHHSFMCTVDFSPDGTLVATGGDDGTARIWEAATGKPILRLEGHEERLGFVSFSRDGSRLASSSDDGTVRIWDVRPEGRREVVAMADPTVVFEARYSPDGSRIIGSSMSGVVHVWDARTGRLERDLVGHESWVYTNAFTPDGTRIVTGSRDGTVRVWDATTGTPLATRSIPVPAIGLAVSPDSSAVAIGTFEGAYLWSVATDELRSLESGGQLFGVAFSPDGSLMALGRAFGIQVLDTNNLESRHTIEFTDEFFEEVLSVQFTADGMQLLTAHRDGTARLWDLDREAEIQRYEGHNGLVWDAALSPDESKVATASFDGTVRVWDAVSGAELLRFEDDQAFSSVSFSPDGRHLLVSGDFGARVHTLDIEELLDLARDRLLRGWTPEECFQFLGTTTCPERA